MPPLGLEVMVAEKMMSRGKKRRVQMGKAVQLQVPGPDQKMMGEAWWKEGELADPVEGWRGVMTDWPEGMWTGVGKCLLLESVGMRTAADQRQDKLDSLLPHLAGLAVGKVQKNTGEGVARVRSRWVARGRWIGMVMEAHEQAQVLMENLEL